MYSLIQLHTVIAHLPSAQNTNAFASGVLFLRSTLMVSKQVRHPGRICV